ncbi:MAG: hypothetical protein RL264_2852 [Bacteroidota bacterium]|jgi:hypothetical protein
MTESDEFGAGIIDLFIGGIFIILGIWSINQPYYALITGLTFYIVFMIIILQDDWNTKRIVISLFIIIIMIRGILSALKIHENKSDDHESE